MADAYNIRIGGYFDTQGTATAMRGSRHGTPRLSRHNETTEGRLSERPLTWSVVGPVGGGPSSAVGRARDASTPPKSSRWGAEIPMGRTHPLRLRRPLGYGPLPNKGWCRNSGKNEIGCGNRCRHRARRSSARRRAAPALWDTSHRNGKPCRCAAGTPCSGKGKPDPAHLWQLLEASRSGIDRFVPSAFPWLLFPASACPGRGQVTTLMKRSFNSR